MALSLLEQSKLIQDPQKLFVVQELMESELMRLIPFKNIAGGGEFYNQEDELPDVDFRAFNEGQDDSLGTLRPEAEQLRLFGGDVKVDSSQIDLYGDQARAAQVEMKVRAMRMRFEDLFINGNASAPNPRHFDGLRKRLNTGSSQAINNGASGTGVSLAAIDELLDAVESGGAEKLLVMPKYVRRQLSAAGRDPALAGNINYRPDEFGKQVMFYGDARIIVTDVNNQNQPVQGFTEANDTTSIYALSFGDTLLSGIQGIADGQYGLSVRDLGESHTAPVMLTRIKWHLSFSIYRTRAAARLYNIEQGAAVA